MLRWREQARLLMRKAGEDDWTARKLSQDKASPLPIIGFHVQQAVEKYLKAVLSYRQVEYPRTHDIEDLMTLLERQHIPLPEDADDLIDLTPYGVVCRYEDPAPPTQAQWNRTVATFAEQLTKTKRWAESFIVPDGPEGFPQPSGPVV